jgi:hypothetical protein
MFITDALQKNYGLRLKSLYVSYNYMKNFILTATFMACLVLSSILVAANSQLNVDITSNTTSIMPGEPVEFTVNVTNTGKNPVQLSNIQVHGIAGLTKDIYKLSADPMWNYCTTFIGNDVCSWNLGTLGAGESKIIKIVATGDKVGSKGTVVYSAYGTNSSHKLYVGIKKAPWIAIIPEFSDIAVPIILSLVSFGAILRIRKK